MSKLWLLILWRRAKGSLQTVTEYGLLCRDRIHPTQITRYLFLLLFLLATHAHTHVCTVHTYTHTHTQMQGYLQMSEEESMQARPSLDRLMDQQRRRPSMDLIVEESPNTNIVTTPLASVHSKNAPPGRSASAPSRDSSGGVSSSVRNTSDRALSSIANGSVMTGAIPSSRTPPIPLTKNLQETTV